MTLMYTILEQSLIENVVVLGNHNFDGEATMEQKVMDKFNYMDSTTEFVGYDAFSMRKTT